MTPLITEKVLREDIVGVSSVTWWTWRKNGKLDALTPLVIGSRRFFRSADVEAWMDAIALRK
ncbi:MAG: helix-turn-helix domain-containing protein [Deltaproteobacteria bacterium]|nr:helix-turn-helix domain-containing protein [Deltaproteobacteria bacterium]